VYWSIFLLYNEPFKRISAKTDERWGKTETGYFAHTD
jgi:hypothetical protein